jgi:CHAD domain-containing protein
MAYRLRAGKPVAEEIKRIVCQEIASAIRHLSGKSAAHKEEAIHEARKSIKKIRAILRLVRPQLGRIYRQENQTLRDAGRRLSQIRDAAAMVEVFDELVVKFRDDLQTHAWAGIRRGLEDSKREVEAAAIDSIQQHAITALRRVDRHVNNWPLSQDGFQTGLEKTYRQGRRALAGVQRNPTAENYHQFRKRVKDHWYHIRLLGNLNAREDSLRNLQTWLGDDHNLVLLQQKLEHEPENFGEQREIELFQALIAQHQKELREKAISLGLRLYEQKPRQFIRSL